MAHHAAITVGGVMDVPEVAATYALLSALQSPPEPKLRMTLDRWRPEATELLAELLKDRGEAREVMMRLMSGLPVQVEAKVLHELQSILDANIDLARAEY